MSTLALDGTLPRSRSTDPTTSVDAGRAADLNASQLAVLELMAEVDRTMSDRELVNWSLCDRTWPYSPQRTRSARAELTERGLVVKVEGVFRTSPYGRREQVWQLNLEEN